MNSMMEITSLISNFQMTTILALVLCVVFVLKLQKKEHKNPPPGPPSLPVIGHLHILKDPFHQTLQALSQEYGPVMSLSFGFRRVVIVSSSSAAQECFTKNDHVFLNRPRFISGDILHYDNTAVGSAPYGPLWRNLRRIATTMLLSTHCLNNSIHIREKEVKLWLRGLLRITGQNNSARVDLRSKFTELSYNNLLMLMVGKRYFGEGVEVDSDATRMLENTMKQATELSIATFPADYWPVLRLIDFQGVKKKMKKAKVGLDAFAQSLIDEGRTNMHKEPQTTIERLLALQRLEPHYYTDDIIKGQFLSLLVAGTDTSLITLEWAMSLLLNYPTVMKKAWTEINEAVGDQRLVEEADLNKLPYLESIVHETNRLFPPLPVLAPRQSLEDCRIEGHDIPKGTMLLVNAWAIHRDPKVWPEPNCFRPERFKEGETVEVSKVMTFGMGRRACPGSGLAFRVVALALASMIQCFEWDRLDQKEVDLAQGIGLTMPKASPLVAMCKPRTSMLHLLSQL